MNFQCGHLDRALAKSLPCLPGYNFNLNVGNDRFHKHSHCGINQNARFIQDYEGWRPGTCSSTGLQGYQRLGSVRNAHTALHKPHSLSQLPSWLEFDKKVLAFDAYYQEPVPESPLENYRIHVCKIYFYLEDDSVQVIEPKTHNAGLPQGQIIRRHQIPLSSFREGRHYTLEHFNVDNEVALYGKVFRITGCDGFTRKFLNRLGIPVPRNKEIPKDPATLMLEERKSNQIPRRPHHAVDTRGSYLKHSGHVLRFWSKLYGDLRQFVLNYFLSDETIEILEILQPNSGYEAYPVFLRRGKVPKKCENLVELPGAKAPVTILNVFGSMYPKKDKKAHWIVDNLAPQEAREYYTDHDLSIGAILNIYGRPFVLTNCDEFTKRYYKDKYGIDNFKPLALEDENVREPTVRIRTPLTSLPESYEHELGIKESLRDKPRSKDYRKQAALEKCILRFEAKFENARQKVNQSRRFVINYYMSDDTIQVFEREHPNSGLPKGTFLYRNRVKKPSHPSETKDTPRYYYSYKDFFIGNILNINGYDFRLLNADEFTLSYMEAHKDLFPQSDIDQILPKIRDIVQAMDEEEVLKRFAEKDTSLKGVIDAKDFRSVLSLILKNGLNEHEILTLIRAFASKEVVSGPNFKAIQAVAQTELQRCHYDRLLLARIEYTLRYHDLRRTGKVDRQTLRATLKGAKVPIFRELLDYMVDTFPTAKDDMCNQVDYCDFLKFLDWERNPTPLAKPAASRCLMKWVDPKTRLKTLSSYVNYCSFLESVCPKLKASHPPLHAPPSVISDPEYNHKDMTEDQLEHCLSHQCKDYGNETEK